jgi:hypothetical protein
MKKLLIFIVLVLTAFSFNGCNKEKAPSLILRVGGDYVSKDQPLARVERTYKVGIDASRSASNFNLGNFKIIRQYDEDQPVTIEATKLNSTQWYSFTRDIFLTMRNKVGTEVYTFELVDQNGAKAVKTIKFIVQ